MLRQQPQGPARIDRSNVLGRKVIEHVPLTPSRRSVSGASVSGLSYRPSRLGFALDNATAGVAQMPLDLSAHRAITVAFSYFSRTVTPVDEILLEFTPNYNVDPGFIFYLGSAGDIQLGVRPDGAAYSVYSIPLPAPNTWHRVLATFDVDVATATGLICTDGIEQTKTDVSVGYTGSGGANFANSDIYLLDRAGGVIPANAMLAALTIYRGVLTPAEARLDAFDPWQILVQPRRGSFAVSLAQFLRPEADITAGGWVPSSGSDLYAMIDEAVADEADYDSTPVASTMEVRLSDGIDPAVSTGHKVRYRIKGTSDLVVTLLQGGTTIASWTHAPAPASYTTYTQTLSGGEADAISDYSDLRLRFTAS